MQSLTLSLALCAAPLLSASEVPSPQHIQWMKESGALNGKIRKGEDVPASATRLAAIYKEAEAFWAKRSDVGAKTTKDIQSAAAAIAADPASAATQGRTIGGACRTCHDQHREKISETEYKIK